MDVRISTPEVGASPDVRSQQDAVSKSLYDLGVLLMYGGSVALVIYFLFI
jgi:hypothetical protein